MKLFKRKSKLNIEVIIDDIFQLIPSKDFFAVEPFLEQVLQERGLFTSRDIFFVEGAAKIETILLSYNLVNKIKEEEFILTDRGFLAKELGGLTKFKRYRQQELTALPTQRLINIGLLVIGLLSLAAPFVSEWYKNKFFNDSPLKQPVHVIVDSSFLILHSDQVKQNITPSQQLPKDTTKRHPRQAATSQKKH